MSERPPRPRAFRLDDRRIAVDDQPAPFAPEAIIRSQHEPIPAAAPAPIDEAELEIEAAQKSGLIARSRLTLARLAWTGLGGLVSLALGLVGDEPHRGPVRQGGIARMIGLVFGLVFLVGLVGVAAREIIAVARQTRIAELHVAFADARAADDRAAARRAGRPARRALSRPAGDGAGAGRGRGGDAGDHRRARPHRRRRARAAAAARRQGARRDRRGGQARVAGDRDQPARDARRRVRRRADRAADPAHRRDLRRPAGPARLLQARALDRRAYRDHRRHGGRRQPAAAARRPRHRLAHLGADGRRRAQRPAHGAGRPVRAGRLPAGARSRSTKPPGVSEVAPFLFSGGKGE